MVEVTVTADEFAGVLADALVALEDRLTRYARDPHGHLGILGRDHDRGDADLHRRRRDHKIEITHGQLDPLSPGNRAEIERPIEVPGTVLELWVGNVDADRRGEAVPAPVEGDEGLLDGAMADDLPGTVERQDNWLVEDVAVHGRKWAWKMKRPSPGHRSANVGVCSL